MSDRPLVVAYCHPDEVAWAQWRIDTSADKGVVVTPHLWMKKGEVILYSPQDLEFEFELPPYYVAHRHMMEEIENPLATIADTIRLQIELRAAYRLPTTY